MDLLKKRLDIARLVAEELTGTIDEKNRIVLARWLDEDERHRKEYTNILESLKTGNEVWKDQERGRQLMESRWRAVKSHTVRKTGRWITWSKYAAVVLLFVSIGIFWLVNDGTGCF
jgi:transmembrane sensor